jgi:secondary thiamine-phosphate synthase enzyme
MIHTGRVKLDTGGRFAVVNITDQVREFVSKSGINEGVINIFYQHTTGGVIIGEHEAGIIADLQDMFEELIPSKKEYKHHVRDVDFNGHAHVRSALLTISVTVPILDSKLTLGTYQEVLVIDMQTERAPRYVVLQVQGV